MERKCIDEPLGRVGRPSDRLVQHGGAINNVLYRAISVGSGVAANADRHIVPRTFRQATRRRIRQAECVAAGRLLIAEIQVGLEIYPPIVTLVPHQPSATTVSICRRITTRVAVADKEAESQLTTTAPVERAMESQLVRYFVIVCWRQRYIGSHPRATTDRVSNERHPK